MEEPLDDVSLVKLQKAWREQFRNRPPKQARKDFLSGHLAWARQAEEHGGFKRGTMGELKRLMRKLRDDGDIIPDHSMTLKPGTRLLRQHQGVQHEVTVVEGGFTYRDKLYPSLSMIAREITGTRWNGKVFFGLKRQ